MRPLTSLHSGPISFMRGVAEGASSFLTLQPMQAMMVPTMTSGQVFSGLVMGITKGLVGAISKPVAGAAGFISQTGQGILRGNGLFKFPPRRHAAVPITLISHPESTLKYIWKVAPLLPQNVRTLAVAPASLVSGATGPEPAGAMSLFLSDSALFLISPMDDEFRQAYSLTKLNLRIGGRSVAEDGSGDQVRVTLLAESVESEENGMIFVGTYTAQSVMEMNHSRREYARDSYLLDWRDALLFEELFLVA